MATPDQELVGTLKKLFEACKNAENGCRTAAKEAKREDLKALFQGYAEHWGRYSAEWQGELERLGAHDHQDSGTVAETLKQSWAELSSTVMGGGDESWIAECARVEEAARKEFEEVLKRDLPAGVAAAARRQLVESKDAQDRLRGLGAK